MWVSEKGSLGRASSPPKGSAAPVHDLPVVTKALHTHLKRYEQGKRPAGCIRLQTVARLSRANR